MASDGLIFSLFAKINEKTKTPLISTVVCGVFAGKNATTASFNYLSLLLLFLIGFHPPTQVLSRPYSTWSSSSTWLPSAPCRRTRSCAYACWYWGESFRLFPDDPTRGSNPAYQTAFRRSYRYADNGQSIQDSSVKSRSRSITIGTWLSFSNTKLPNADTQYVSRTLITVFSKFRRRPFSIVATEYGPSVPLVGP